MAESRRDKVDPSAGGSDAPWRWQVGVPVAANAAGGSSMGSPVSGGADTGVGRVDSISRQQLDRLP